MTNQQQFESFLYLYGITYTIKPTNKNKTK